MGKKDSEKKKQGNAAAASETQAQPPQPSTQTQPPLVPVETLPPEKTIVPPAETKEASAAGTPVPAAATSVVKAEKKEEPGDWWWKCWRCAKKAKVFCVDAKKGEEYLCHRCCAFEHEYDFKKVRFNSLEAINPKQTTSIILALVDAVVLPATILYLIRQTGIPEGYNDGIDVCPLIDQARSLVFSIDAGISLYTKHYFMSACNIEDGYVRLWIDVFVRNIATNTDSLFLLAVTAFRAQLYHKIVIRMVFVPIAMICYAMFVTLVYFFTQGLPNIEDNSMVAPFKRKLTKWVDQVQAPSKRLPNTLSRSRPSKQYKDFFSYNYGRITRQFRWFKQSAGNRLEALSQVAYRIPICIRLCCMMLQMGWVFEAIAKIVVPDQFWNSPNINFAQVSKDTYSGLLLESIGKWAMRFVFRHASTVASFIVSYTPPIVLRTVTFIARDVLDLEGNLIMARDILLENYVVVLCILVMLAIPWAVRRWLKRVEEAQLRRFNEQAADKYNFTTYEARMKWMPLVN